MKASERKKNKFKAIKEHYKMIKLDKDKIRLFYPKRHERDTLARYVFLETVEKLHRDLFALRAMEKQIKMPVKLVVRRSRVAKYNWEDDGKPTVFFNRYISYCCSRCGEFLIDEPYDESMNINYCPRCGQKLWWE